MTKTILSMFLLMIASISFAESSNYPARGTSMDGVINQSGEPEKKIDAIGQPPITRWVYADYTVYFEHQAVIHVVKNDK